MWKIEGQALMRTQRILGKLSELGVLDAEWLIGQMSWFEQNLDLLEAELKKLNLPVSAKKVLSVRALCANPTNSKAFTQILSSSINDLRDRIEDEIETRYIFSISADAARFIRRERTVLDSHVEATFPDAIFDLHEAAECIALSRYTAAVFHLMRGMESAISKAGTSLDATIIDRNGKNLSWGKLIANLGAKISTMESGSKKDDWQMTHAMLYSVKEAWRNDTMHPKQTYTEEEAVEIFDAVKSFIRRLAALLE